MAEKNTVDHDKIKEAAENDKIKKWIIIAAAIIAIIFIAIVVRYIIGGNPDVHTIESNTSVPNLQDAIDSFK